jgi:uncharacterized protein YfaS (alpha-2-macroglobulin family)
MAGELMNLKESLYLKAVCVLFCVALLSGCQVPVSEGSTPVPVQDEVVEEPVGPLPAALVEASPMPGSILGVNREVTFYFNQAMDTASVEAAISISPDVAGSLSWEDDSVLTFSPTTGWPMSSEISIVIGADAQSADGQGLQQETTLEYSTADYLALLQSLPEAGTFDVDPTAAIVASFNYPVVPLGADPASQSAAFTLTPAAEGRGEWVNTSTYIFYPEPGLFGGQGYTVTLDPSLQSLEGAPLEAAFSWSFTTAQPELISVYPQVGEREARLDAQVVLTFNQPMDTASLENGFLVAALDGSPVAGSIEWSETDTVLTFTPDDLFARGERYIVTIPQEAQSRGGSRLSSSFGDYYFYAANELYVQTTNPANGGLKNYYQNVMFEFNAPVDEDTLEGNFRSDPELDLDLSIAGNKVYVFGYFMPEEQYTITADGGLEDIWGGQLGTDYQLTFYGAPLDISFGLSSWTGGGVLFVNPDRPGATAQVVNVDRVYVEIGSLPVEEFIYQQGEADYDARQEYRPAQTNTSTQTLSILRNRNQQVGISINNNNSLTPGVYWVSLTPDPAPNYSQPQRFFAVVSHVQMVFKNGPEDVLVWAIDTRTKEPVANAPVTIYNRQGEQIGTGLTDANGIFHTGIQRQEDLYPSNFAVLYAPGDELFSMATSSWDWGISPYSFGYWADYSPNPFEYYVYTDRPIYRPGQMVQYRVIARSAFNGRYKIPEEDSVQLAVRDYNGAELASYTLNLSEFGTAAGAYFLSDGAQPGYYELKVGEPGSYSYLIFQVAEYRKPEVDLQIGFNQEEVLAGAFLDAEVLAEYFFDAPVGDVDATWDLYVDDEYFYLPGYRVGPLAGSSYSPWSAFSNQGMGTWQEGGMDTTDENGSFEVNLQTAETDRIQEYTLEVTVTDESGMPVSNRTSAIVHPDPVYIGLRSDSWVGKVDEEMGLDVYVVDWDRNSAGVQSLEVDFGKVDWERHGPDMFGFYSYQKTVEVLSEGALQTNSDGKARLSFTPAEPGVYQVEVRSGRALTQLLFWVGGPGTGSWPSTDDNEVSLVADAESYSAGDTANVFIPNPFPGDAKALVTVERGLVISYEALTISGSGVTYSIPLDEDSVPNVYLSVSMVGETEAGTSEYYFGLTNLDVEVVEQILNVEVIGDPERAGPGDTVSFTIRVTDSDGSPVEGEFSLSVVDEAVLALADPYEEDIVTFFYDRQRIGVHTSSSLLAASDYYIPDTGGLGGGGGDGAIPETRDEFRDTAYWNGSIVTGADGTAVAAVVLPDNLTSWRVQVRGVTKDTQVGEAISEVVTTKELIVRPVLPRFAVIGDHLQIGAVVHNNTGDDLQVSMAFQVSGLTLDNPDSALQDFEVPANGRTEITWWGVVGDAEQIETIFAVEGGGYSDITTQQNGAVPVYSYMAPQTFSTAGVLAEGGERLEVISLPSTFDPAAGGLSVEMTSSLAAVALDGLEAIREVYPAGSIEYSVSRFLPNLEMLKALREFGLDDPDLEAELSGEVRDLITEISMKQNYDGGWGWNAWQDSPASNPYVSAYALLGLVRAEEMGYPVNEYQVDRAVQYLIQFLVETELDETRPWMFDRFAFVHFVLTEAGSPLPSSMTALLAERDKLSPWAQALLYLAVETVDPGNQGAASMFSNLQANAVRSAGGAHWDDTNGGWQNMSSDTFNNAVVILALARTDPASPLLTDAVRYLVSYRDAEGGWSSSYTTAWALIALTEVMRGTGELGGDFAFAAELNNHAFASGEAGGVEQFVPVFAEASLAELLSESPNALIFSRDPGTGRLYYRANLAVAQPVEDVEGLDHGITVTREYFPTGEDCTADDCEPITTAEVGDLVTVRVTLTLPNSLNYVRVEDYIPAGTEVLNTNLLTSKFGGGAAYYDGPLYDPRDPYSAGWGWWFFGEQAVFDEHVSWNAEFLPAGTYQLTYQLVVLQPGEFQVIPAKAYQVYFPDVQGISAGDVFEVGE